jgi:hypothetical protein
MCRTDAKNTYWLNDADLGYLNYHEYIHTRSKLTANVFWLSDVKNLALFKHGTQDAVAIRDIKNSKNAALVKRKKQLETILGKVVDENDRNEIRKMQFCQCFLKGGALGKSCGARVLSKFIGPYTLFASKIDTFRAASPSFSNVSRDRLALFDRLVYDALHAGTSPIEELEKKYMENVARDVRSRDFDGRILEIGIDISTFAPSVIAQARMSYVNTGDLHILIEHRRRALLETELNKYNLPIRGDSATCMDFIRHGPGAGGIERVVTIVREMHFYYTFTDYSNIYRGKLNNAYRYNKGRKWDYDTDDDEYDDDDDDDDDYYDRVNIHQISANAKEIARNKYKGVIPSYVLEAARMY